MIGIDAQGVTVAYRGGHVALVDANLQVPMGSITALVGMNGAGKSTLFKALLGFVPLRSGQVRILGQDVRAAMRAQSTAYVPQTEEVDWNFPILVEDVVMMGRFGHMGFLRRARRRDYVAVDQALARVGMEHLRMRQIGELSGGQKKRVFLARALAQEAQVILLDEPFTGVDIQTEEHIIALLQELRSEGHVMLVATHNLGSVPEYCDRVALVKGTVIAQGPTAQVFTVENLQQAFGGVLRHFMLQGDALHDDADPRRVDVLTDEERALVFYDNEPKRADPG